MLIGKPFANPSIVQNTNFSVPIAQLGGMTLGLSISGAVFINTAQQSLTKALPNIPIDQISQLVAGASNKVMKSLSEELRIVVFEVIVSSWQKVFIGVYVGAAVSFVASIFMNVCPHQTTVYCCKKKSKLLTPFFHVERSCQHQGHCWGRLRSCRGERVRSPSTKNASYFHLWRCVIGTRTKAGNGLTHN